jgi:WD repeat-containing protein 90
VDGNYAFTVTRSSDAPQPYLQAESCNKDFEITIWDVQDAQQVFSFKPPLSLLHSISLNQSESKADHFLCVSGRDFQKRDAIIIYNFDELIGQKRVEIYARQLCDFDLVNIRFNDASPSSLVACGRENIRFFKIKNGHLPGQLVTLNNTARGKTFCQSLVDFTIGEKGTKKATTVYVTTHDGLLYFVNYGTRQIDKII